MLWILIDIERELLAFPGTEVLEVVPAIAPQVVTGCEPPWLGVIQYRGQIIPVLDLCSRLGISLSRNTMRQRILVVRNRFDHLVGLQVPSARPAIDDEHENELNNHVRKITRHTSVNQLLDDSHQYSMESFMKGLQV